MCKTGTCTHTRTALLHLRWARNTAETRQWLREQIVHFYISPVLGPNLKAIELSGPVPRVVKTSSAFWSASSTSNQLGPSVPARNIAAAMSASKHADLRWLSPKPLPLPPSPPLPVRPSVSGSSETGKRGACCAWGGSSSAATTRGGSAAFAGAGKGRVAHRVVWAARSPRCEGERRRVRKVGGEKEGESSSQRELALSIVRTVCRPTRSDSDSGSVDGSSGPSARTGSGDPAGGFWGAKVL